MASKGATEANRETGTKRHLQPQDTFSGLLMHPKCNCGQGCATNPAGGTYSAPPDPLACCPLIKNLFPALGHPPWISWFPLDKFPATLMGSVRNQNCCKGFSFKEKLEKHFFRVSSKLFMPCWWPSQSQRSSYLSLSVQHSIHSSTSLCFMCTCQF